MSYSIPKFFSCFNHQNKPHLPSLHTLTVCLSEANLRLELFVYIEEHFQTLSCFLINTSCNSSAFIRDLNTSLITQIKKWIACRLGNDLRYKTWWLNSVLAFHWLENLKWACGYRQPGQNIENNKAPEMKNKQKRLAVDRGLGNQKTAKKDHKIAASYLSVTWLLAKTGVIEKSIHASQVDRKLPQTTGGS